MTQVEDKTGAAISQDSHFSDVFSSLVKAVQRGNRQNDVEKGRKSFRKKVGSMVSTVFGKQNKFPHGNDESLNIRSDETIVKSSDGDGEGKAEPSGGSERKEGRRTYLKYLRKRVGNVGSDESSGGGEAGRQWQKAKRGVSEMMKGEEGEGEGEVWRKRILMGGKCRPLNGSGVIHYDENGVLIPESHHI